MSLAYFGRVFSVRLPVEQFDGGSEYGVVAHTCLEAICIALGIPLTSSAIQEVG
jgi:hypothetical protein